MDEVYNGPSDKDQADPRFADRVAFVPMAGNRASNADIAGKFVRADPDEAKEISRVLLN
jgi:hypothetical protein